MKLEAERVAGLERLDREIIALGEQRAMRDVIERAWLKDFVDGWLTRMPSVVLSEAAE